ncbi:hypothetical protein T4B_13185 [Trichinella pseudospiralis]|uniref:Uncharacterized protein n=3 Tax=Trichinella pseudospiralis TaxID=6337 RepID=A0A0V1GSW3_TRIPS|nr:hypothetical protein T4B_13185 [Trichinella pseudospiralis]
MMSFADVTYVITKRSVEETKPILPIYGKEVPTASAVPSTSGYFLLFSGTTMAGEDILLWQSASRHILVLARGSNIRLMAARRIWALDSTFNVVPQWYQQLFPSMPFWQASCC